jgi:maleamate amidohydrolase
MNSTPKVWDGILPAEEAAVFAASGHGPPMGWGARPALLVVDVNLHFIGDRPEPVLASIERWPYSCGNVGWAALPAIRRLLDAARAAGVPRVFTTGVPPGPTSIGPGRWADKSARPIDPDRMRAGHTIADAIAPAPGELIVEKEKPSAFFGTSLPSYLIDRGVDSVIVCGATTSGCVRATVVDAFSYNLKIAVVEEATFDRSATSHAINLMDMHQKYADVVSVDAAAARLVELRPSSAAKAD